MLKRILIVSLLTILALHSFDLQAENAASNFVVQLEQDGFFYYSYPDPNVYKENRLEDDLETVVRNLFDYRYPDFDNASIGSLTLDFYRSAIVFFVMSGAMQTIEQEFISKDSSNFTAWYKAKINVKTRAFFDCSRRFFSQIKSLQSSVLVTSMPDTGQSMLQRLDQNIVLAIQEAFGQDQYLDFYKLNSYGESMLTKLTMQTTKEDIINVLIELALEAKRLVQTYSLDLNNKNYPNFM